jgi:hypothetical protein
MNDKIYQILDTPGLEKLRDFVYVGPAQRASVELFVVLLANECATVISANRNEAFDLGMHTDEAMSLLAGDIANCLIFDKPHNGA